MKTTLGWKRSRGFIDSMQRAEVEDILHERNIKPAILAMSERNEKAHRGSIAIAKCGVISNARVFLQRAEGSREQRIRSARDPSLRLKNGFAQDDAHGKPTGAWS